MAALPSPEDGAGVTTVLKADNVSVTLGGNRIIHEVTTELRRGELTALIGPNGAGKSTLFSALAADIEPSAGRVLLDGRDIRSFKPGALALERAVLPQDQVVRFSFSVEEIVGLARHLAGPGQRDHHRVDGPGRGRSPAPPRRPDPLRWREVALELRPRTGTDHSGDPAR